MNIMTSSVQIVSYVLLAYNQDKYVEEAVSSAFAQDCERMEIVISDDASPDGTFARVENMVARYKGPHSVVIHRNEVNLGLAGNYSRALALASGDFVVMAAGDDVAYPHKASRLVQPMLNDPGVAGVHGGAWDIDPSGRRIAMRRRADIRDIEDPRQVVENGLMVVAQCHAFRREVYDRFGPFRPAMTNESVPLTFRETLLGRVAYVDEPLMDYRVGVGVSTEQLADIDDRTIRLPARYASWMYEAYRQILDDYRTWNAPDADLLAAIERKLSYYERLYLINRDEWAWRSLREAVATGEVSRKHVAAFVRRNAPRSLRRLLVRGRS